MSDEVKMPLPGSLQEIVGSLLFASESPLTVAELRDAVRAVEAEEGENKEVMEVYRTCTTKEVEAALRGLEKALEVARGGFRLVCTGGTYRMQTVPSCGRYVRAMLKMDRPSRLGRASLETLAIVAYRQPLTKSEIEDIRGVDVTNNIKTLMDLQVIRIVGKSELPGHPFLYGTTPVFLEHFGLASLQQLNELDPTLQRSNPKKKAEQYKRQEKLALPEAKKEEAKAAAEEAGEESAGEAEDAEATEELAPEATEETSVGVVREYAADDDDDDVGDGGDDAGDSDDDLIIDDTPDEFDDDEDDGDDGDDEDDGDDGEDEDEEGDDEENDDDEEDDDDEDDGGDGADDSDRL